MSDYATLAVVLQRALDLRVDVQKCTVEPQRDDPHLLDVRVVKHGGGKVHREANAVAALGWEKSTGELLDHWIGPEPEISGKRDANWMLARAQAHAYTPAKTVELMVGRQPTPPAELPKDGENTQAPGSKLEGWEDGHEPTAPRAPIADPTPAGHTYVDPTTNETRPMMTRARMVQLGMTKEQRHEQYRRQGGPHPDDPK